MTQPSDNPFDQQKTIEGVKHIITIGSGKGGVGKSTVTAHLAIALKQKGFKTGILDTDIYGPSIPRIFGCLCQKPQINKQNNKLIPLEKYGLKLMSIGFLIDEDQAVIWRGPMLFKVLDQFFRDVDWGELDYLLIDLPPGTGDVALSVAQKVPVESAILVSTPQNLSLIDAQKALKMFQQIHIPVSIFIENMSFLKVSPEAPPLQLFPKGQQEGLLKSSTDLKKFELAFDPQIGMACETGIPLNQLDSSHPITEQFQKISEYLSLNSVQ